MSDAARLIPVEEAVYESRFLQTLEQLRRELPLPSERLALPRSGDQAQVLLKYLRELEGEDWLLFTARLSRSFLRILPLAYTRTVDPRLLGRLDELCRLHASWTLFENAWICLQLNYPCRPLQKALLGLYDQLRVRRDLRPSYLLRVLADEVPLDGNDTDFLAGAVRLLQTEVDPTQRISAFINGEPRTVTEESATDIGRIKRFCNEFVIILDSPFGASMLADYLAALPPLATLHLMPLMIRLLPRIDTGSLARHAHRAMNDASLSAAERRDLLEPLLPLLDDERRRLEFETALGEETSQQLRRWRMLNQLQEHCFAHPVKERFYLDYLSRMLDVAILDSHTIALRFRDFTVIDNLNEPDFAYYYPDALLTGILERGGTVPLPGQVSVPYRRLTNPQEMQHVQGVIQLGFVGSRLDDSRRFMELRLDMQPRRAGSPFGRWLGGVEPPPPTAPKIQEIQKADNRDTRRFDNRSLRRRRPR
ncbi:MAG: hypothetical protein QM296_09380 [Bacillota bacterium]|nr:hypothetical protein [Bacillota bacterium]